MSGQSGESVTHYLSSNTDYPDPLPSDIDGPTLRALWGSGSLQETFDRLRHPIRDRVETWMEELLSLSQFDDLLCALAEVFSHLTSLPPQAMLAPLPPAMDAVAVGLGDALGATSGSCDASRSLLEIFRFLGGTFTNDARYPIDLPGGQPPADRLERWQWLCRAGREAADTADALWRRVVAPLQ